MLCYVRNEYCAKRCGQVYCQCLRFVTAFINATTSASFQGDSDRLVAFLFTTQRTVVALESCMRRILVHSSVGPLTHFRYCVKSRWISVEAKRIYQY